MAFYVRKLLTTGPIRFSVEPRHPGGGTQDSPPRLSTGKAGEYLRLGDQRLFFHEDRNEKSVAYKKGKEKDQGFSFGWGERALMTLGVLLLLLGITIIVKNDDKAGYLPALLGVAMLAGPVVLSAKRRRAARIQLEKERTAREEEDRRNRETLDAFAARIATLPQRHDAAALEEVRAQREAAELPYEVLAPMSRDAATQVGFAVLGEKGAAASTEVAHEIDQVTAALGFTPADNTEVKRRIFERVVWHLLADDRLDDASQSLLESMAREFHLAPELIERETAAIGEFRKLRGVAIETLPVAEGSGKLGFQEQGHHVTSGGNAKLKRQKQRDPSGQVRIEDKWVASNESKVMISSRRLLVGKTEIAYRKLFGIEVDADASLLEIKTADSPDPIHLKLADAIYSAGILELARRRAEAVRGLLENQ